MIIEVTSLFKLKKAALAKSQNQHKALPSPLPGNGNPGLLTPETGPSIEQVLGLPGPDTCNPKVTNKIWQNSWRSSCKDGKKH